MATTVHPKMIKNYFQSTSSGSSQTLPSQPSLSSMRSNTEPTTTTTKTKETTTAVETSSQQLALIVVPKRAANNHTNSYSSLSSTNRIVPKNLKRKIRDILEDENLRANSVPKTVTTEATTTRSITNNNANMSAVIRPQSTPNSDTTSNERASKKTRTTSSCDVKVVTRINLPMTATTATAAKANLLKSSPIQNTNLNLLDNRSVIHHHPKNNNNITRILQLKKLANPHEPQQQQLEQQQKHNHHNHRIYMDLKPSSITTTIKKVEVVLNRSQTQQQPK